MFAFPKTGDFWSHLTVLVSLSIHKEFLNIPQTFWGLHLHMMQADWLL